jgi:hypothetical protein
MLMFQYAAPGPYSKALTLIRGPIYNKRLDYGMRSLGVVCQVGLVVVNTVMQFTFTLLVLDTMDSGAIRDKSGDFWPHLHGL